MKAPQRLYISYGFLGGRRIATVYDRFLETANIQITNDVHAPDIILAHSAGCWRLPDDITPKLLILVGMPLRHPNITRTFRSATRQNRQQYAVHGHRKEGIRIFALSSLYGLLQPKRNYDILKQVRALKPFPAFAGAQTIVFVAGQYDPYPQSSELQEIMAGRSDISFPSMTGSHQDIWEYPERYVALLQLYI